MNLLLAAFPILLILYLMVARRWGAARAGIAGYLAAVLLAATAFGAGLDALWVAHAKSLLLSFDVLYIVWAAYLHFRIADEAGAITALGRGLRRLTADPGMLALVLGFAFASFLQGIGGFGVPIAIVAPMLIGLGFDPLAAVVIPAIGHSWAVTFGSLGSSFQALIASTGLPGEALEVPSAALLGLMAVGAGFGTAHAAAGAAGLRRLWLQTLLLSVGMALVQFGLAAAGLWNMAATGAGAAGLGLSVFLATRDRSARPAQWTVEDPRPIRAAFGAYAALVAIMAAIQLIGPVNDLLGAAALTLEFPEVRTSQGFTVPSETGRVIHWFSHGGAILVYASLAGYLIFRRLGLYGPGTGGRILRDTARGVRSSTVSILAMVAMASVMSHAGMTDTLARGIAAAVGAGFPLVSPWIGAFGAFMTGSNTNSNVVFAALQQRTAEILALSIPWLLGAQTAGGAIGSIVAPTKIVVGAATAGLEGREGEVIRKLAVYVIPLILFLSVVTWIATHL
ncbi:MAG TPA: L-lactate permease [Anaerolineales bacterium]|nr:L-lactate permease [Anaerolineales bacterium]